MNDNIMILALYDLLEKYRDSNGWSTAKALDEMMYCLEIAAEDLFKEEGEAEDDDDD